MDSNLNSRQFLQLCQSGQEERLREIIISEGNKGQYDWTRFRNSNGDTGLHLAAQNGFVGVVKLLLDCCGEAIDVMNHDSKRPLHDAAQFSKCEVVALLIQKGAIVNTFKRADWTPLMLACTKSGEPAKKCVEHLLSAKADPFLINKDGWTAFFVACRTGDYDIVKLFVDKFPRCIDHRSKNGRTALHISVLGGHDRIINLLISKCALLLETKDSVGYTPLHESIKNEDEKIFKQLIDAGADINQIDNVGRTMLHIAAIHANVPVLEYILQNNLIDREIKDFSGQTFYSIAQKHEKTEFVQLINKYSET